MTGYLDCAATAPPLPGAMKAAWEAMEAFGNPSSLHEPGITARKTVEQARAGIAAALGCAPKQVFFTSGGTESITTAILCTAEKNKHIGKHIVSTQIEHAATLTALKTLQDRGWEITLVPPDRSGSIPAARLIAALRPDTALVSMMAVNNETGAIMPWRETACALKAQNPRALFHLDAVQAFCKLPLFPLSPVDLVSVSAHKIGGIKGSGALYIAPGLHIPPLMAGGGQESGMRGGTEAVPAMAAFGWATVTRHEQLSQNSAHVLELKDALLEGLRSRGIGFTLHSPADASPYIINLSPEKGRSEVYIRALSDRGVYVSGGSACTRGAKSHVLAAMGLLGGEIDSALRISFCPESSLEDVDAFCSGLLASQQLF